MLLKDLTTLTASLVSGTLFHVEKSGKAYNIDYTKLAKAIVEEYNGSTLGGSAQTIQAAIGALNSSFAVTDITAQIRADSSYISVSALDVKKCGHIVYASIEFSVTQEIPAYTVILSNFPQSIPTSNVIIGYELNNNVLHSFYMKARSSLAPRVNIPNGTQMLIYLNYLT